MTHNYGHGFALSYNGKACYVYAKTGASSYTLAYYAGEGIGLRYFTNVPEWVLDDAYAGELEARRKRA